MVAHSSRSPLCLVLAFGLATLGALRAHGTEDVLAFLPEKTLGFVVVNRLSDVNDKLQAYAEKLGAPMPDLLGLAKSASGVDQGLDPEGSLMAAMVASVDGRDRMEDSEVLLVLPVSDYDQFVASLGEGAAAELTQRSVAGIPMLVAQKGRHALLVPSDDEHRELLTQVLARDVAALETPWKDWVVKNDVTIVLLRPGVEMLTAKGIAALEMLKAQFAEMDQLGAQAAQVAAAFDMYTDLLRAAQKGVEAGADGLLIDEQGNVRIGGRLRFVEGGEMAQAFKPADAPDQTSEAARERALEGLPGGPFIVAAGASMSDACGELMAKWSVALMKNNPDLYGFEMSDEQAESYLKMVHETMQGMNGFSMALVTGQEGDTFFDGMLAVLRVDSATEYLETYEKAIREFQELADASEGGFPYEMEVERIEVEGVDGIQIKMDMVAALEAQGSPPEAVQMIQALFGDEGKLTARIAPATDRLLLMSYGSEQGFARRLQELKSGGTQLNDNVGIQQAAQLLPSDAAMVGYLSPEGAVGWVQGMIQQFAPPGMAPEIPDFPDAPAIGFAARAVSQGVETELVIPAALPEAIRRYVEQASSQE